MPSPEPAAGSSDGPRENLNQARIWWIDVLRGGAVLGMVLYHVIWDLGEFSIYPVPAGAKYLQAVVAGTFLSISGYCIGGLPTDPARQVRRVARIGIAALIVTVASAIVVPRGTITFGILHLITVGSAVLLILRKQPVLWLLLGLAVLWARSLTRRFAFDGFVWTCFGFENWTYSAADFFPVIPWAAPMFFAAALGHWLPPRPTPRRSSGLIGSAGRHSLLVYLVHQPMILGLLWCTVPHQR